jgi:glycosyltransferase involved in cell wall biosynthesis
MLIGCGFTGFIKLLGQVDIVHARSYVAFAMVLPWLLMSRTPCLFHTEGFWFDEKVDVGTWPRNGRLWRIGKQLEKVMYWRANAISVLTHAARRYLENQKIQTPISVITVCTDLKRFSIEDKPIDVGTLIYVGSLGGWYMSDEMVRFYAAWRKHAHNSRFILATKSPVEDIKQAFAKIGAEHELVHVSVEHHEVPSLIQRAQAAVCFIQPFFSKTGSMPTKLGEYLASGVPVAANIIGDMAEVLKDSQAGVILSDFSDLSLDQAAQKLFERSRNPEVRKEARALAEKWFDLDVSVEEYDRLYRYLG